MVGNVRDTRTLVGSQVHHFEVPREFPGVGGGSASSAAFQFLTSDHLWETFFFFFKLYFFYFNDSTDMPYLGGLPANGSQGL